MCRISFAPSRKWLPASAELAKADPKLAGLKACSRALRAKMERMKNY